MTIVKTNTHKRFLGGTVWMPLLHPGNVVWLSLGVLSFALSSGAYSQQPPIVQAPGTGTPVGRQLLDQQLPGSIRGTVLDGTGAVIIGARVTLMPSDHSASQETLSDEYGQFSFAEVVLGSFQIRVIATGFAAQTLSGILHAGEIYIAPLGKMAPAVLDSEVEVTVPRAEVAEEEIKAQEKQRVFGIVPNFYVSYVHDAVSLTSKQKMELAWKATIDPVTFGLTGLVAGVQQAQNAFSGYGQGGQGYAKRFGANYADATTSIFIGSAILPALLKQDPRYFYKGAGSTRSRILYAIANSVICKGDNQRWQPNYSAILGGFASGGISNLYYPAKDRGAALVFENTLIGTGETALLNLFQEFFVRKLTPHVPSYVSTSPVTPSPNTQGSVAPKTR